MGHASNSVMNVDPYNRIKFYYKDDSNPWSLKFVLYKQISLSKGWDKLMIGVALNDRWEGRQNINVTFHIL